MLKFGKPVHCKNLSHKTQRETRATELFLLTILVCFDGKQRKGESASMFSWDLTIHMVLDISTCGRN